MNLEISFPPPRALGLDLGSLALLVKSFLASKKKNTGVWLLTGQSEAAINDLFCGAKAHKSHLKTAP